MNKDNKVEREQLTGVGHGDFVDFIRVEPDLATTALEDASGEPLLELQRHHRCLPFFPPSPLRLSERKL